MNGGMGELMVQVGMEVLVLRPFPPRTQIPDCQCIKPGLFWPCPKPTLTPDCDDKPLAPGQPPPKSTLPIPGRQVALLWHTD